MAKKPVQQNDFEDFEDELEEPVLPARNARAKPVKPKPLEDDDDEIDFHFNENPSTHSHTELDDFEDMPEPPPVKATSHKPSSGRMDDREEFADIDDTAVHYNHGDEEEELADEELVDENGDPIEEKGEEDHENGEAEPAKKSKLGNAIVAGGGLVMLLIASFFGYKLLSGPSTSSNVAPVVAPVAQTSTPNPVRNTTNTTTTPPVLPSVNQPTQTASSTVPPRLPPLPSPNNSGVNSNAVNTPVLPATKAPEPVLPNNMVSPSTNPSVASLPATLPSLPTTPTPTVAPTNSDMGQLLDSFKSINEQIELVRKRGDDIAANLKRLPQIESKIEQVDSKVEGISNRTTGLEDRITALEQYRSAPTPAASNGGINPRVNENRSLPTLTQYHLAGVSRTAVLMTFPPNNETHVVNLHQNIPGVGIAEDLVWDASTARWMLVTSSGIVR